MSAVTLEPAAPRPPSRIIAAVLSLISPGVGHLYIGQRRRALIIIAALLVSPLLFFAAAFALPPTARALTILGAGSIAVLVLLYLGILIDAVRLARRDPASPRAPWYVLAGTAAALIGINFAIGHFGPAIKATMPWQTFSVASTSMQPTLLINEWLIADTRYYASHAPARGDIMLYRYPGDERTIYIKRIVGLPGDRVAFRENHAIVNGVAQSEPFADFGDTKSYYASTLEVAVPPGHLFVAGDNRANSSDSRVKQHGFVPMENLVARATELFMSDDPARDGMWVGSPER